MVGTVGPVQTGAAQMVRGRMKEAHMKWSDNERDIGSKTARNISERDGEWFDFLSGGSRCCALMIDPP